MPAHLRLRHLGTTRMSPSAVLTVPSRDLTACGGSNCFAATASGVFGSVIPQRILSEI
jgi:hypothetical protein